MSSTEHITPVRLYILRSLKRWYRLTQGGQYTLDLEWKRREGMEAQVMVDLGLLRFEHPSWRAKGFYVLTDEGERVLAEAEG